MKDNIINIDILKKSVKLARVIDDNVERDSALSKIAQIQAAINCPEDALETIALIHYDDIRADAERNALDNLLAHYASNNNSMPNLDFWLDKLIEDTMAIPEPEIRCPKLHNINLIILSRLKDKQKTLSILKMTRRELAMLDNVQKRSKYLFAVYQLFQQMDEEAEAVATLKTILKRTSEYRPVVEQGVMLGMIAHEYWKMGDQLLAIECIQHAESAKAQSYGFLQLIKLLAVSGKIDDALPFVDLLETEKHKSMGKRFIEIGKSIIDHIAQMPGVVISINKSYFYRNSSQKGSDYFFNNNPKNKPFPVWFGVTVSITSEKNSQSKNDANNNTQQSDENSDNPLLINDSGSQEDDMDKYDWDVFDWESIKENHKEIVELMNNSDDDDSEDDDSDDDDSDDDDSDDDDSEDDEFDDDSEDDDSDDNEFDDDSEDDDFVDNDSDIKNSDDNKGDSDNRNFNMLARMLYRKFREIFQNNENTSLKNLLQKLFNNNDVSKAPNLKAMRDINERYFCITESIQGAVSFNRTLPTSLFQHFLRKLTQFFNILNKNNETRMFSDIDERIEKYTERQKKIGFDNVWQEVIAQGDYNFAVVFALNHFCLLNKDKLIFGYESSF